MTDQNYQRLRVWDAKYNAERLRPEVRVSFHTKDALYQASGTLASNTNAQELDPSYQVISVTTQKSLSSPAGAFTITLAGHAWLDRINANDLVVIRMGNKDKGLYTVMVGLVDRVRRSATMQGETPMTSTTIIGRDFGKLLLKSQLKFYPEVGQSTGSSYLLADVGWINMVKFFTSDNIAKGNPDALMNNIISKILRKIVKVQWTVYDTEKGGANPSKVTVNYDNILRYQFQKINFFLPFMLTSDQFEGSIWNLMERCSIRPLTELFVDCRGWGELWNYSTTNKGTDWYPNEPRTQMGNIMPKDSYEYASEINAIKKTGDSYAYYPIRFGGDGAEVSVILRNTPFYDKDWNKLTRHYIYGKEVLSEDLSKSDDTHYNLFWAGTTINPLGIDLKRVAPPLMNEDMVKKFGLSPLEVQVDGLYMEQTDSSASKNLEAMSKAQSATLKAWYQNNHNYWEGSLEMMGRADIRIGQVAQYTYANKEFYIEGVNQNFNMFSSWTTSLTLTRGRTMGTMKI